MQLIPRALVVGGFIPPAPPGQQQVTVDGLNRIWSELAPAHGFTQFQIAPDQSSGQLLGRTVDHGVTIQPPLVQTREPIATTVEQSSDNAQAMLRVVLRHVGAHQLFNLGIKLVYSAPLPDNDARNFVLRRVLSRDDESLADIAAGSTEPWGGAKYVFPRPDRHYTLTIEPFQLDQMRSVFLDLDAQFPGEVGLDSIIGRAKEANDYLTGPVNRYLDGLAELS